MPMNLATVSEFSAITTTPDHERGGESRIADGFTISPIYMDP